MSLPQYFSFLSFTLVIFAAPGPAVIFSVHNGINYGRKKALVGTLGNVTALFILVIFAATSLGLAIASSPNTLIMLQIIGAAYLFYLGFKMAFLTSLSSCTSNNSKAPITPTTLYQQGFLVTLTNPKALAYLIAVMPQFLAAKGAASSQLMIMAPTIASAQLLVFGSYIYFAHQLREWLLIPERIRLMNYAAGGVLMGFGVWMFLP